MLTLDRPTLDFIQLAGGMGIEGGRINDLDGFVKQLQYAMAHKGPYLIDVVM
jgi:acetolactate synthase-1/2/3 large subunit